MTPVKFKGHNVVFAENQPEYNSLPAHVDTENGVVVTCWELTENEREAFLKDGRIYLQQITFNQPLQPILPTVENSFDLLK